jgi:hypothetical protein
MAWIESSSCEFSFQEDSWTKFDCSEEEPLGILNEVADILTDVLALDYDYDIFQLLPQPTPIGSMGGVAIVQELSARDDCHLTNSAIANDVVALLSADSHSPKRPLDTEESPLVAFSSPQTKKKKLVAAEQATQNTDLDFHGYQCEKWDSSLQELLDFKQTHGHCGVPNIFPSNPSVAQWVKRQRYQHKLKMQGKRNTLTDARQQVLEMVGFVWDSQEAAWMERWNELRSFWMENGHSNVPTNYESNRQLWIWVKCQRRQYKLNQAGRPSNMTIERITKMESLGFNWNPRKLKL